jgi:osmoprotectant transport system ATP-binding protein
MLELRGVSKAYGKTQALQPTDLRIPPRQTTVLLGPSGCGKSTILRLLLGILRPDTGTVFLDGEELTPSSAPRLRQRMGYVVQDGGLFPHLTARGNIELMARHLGWETERVQRRIGELADLTQFPHNGLNRYPVQLSGGQRQRVGLMRGLMLDPAVLLLDEPLGALDPLIRSDLQSDLRRIFQTLGKTVILVTHDLAEAAFLGNHLVLLRGGRVLQQGTLGDFLEKPADPFVSNFINTQRSLLTDGDGGKPDHDE